MFLQEISVCLLPLFNNACTGPERKSTYVPCVGLDNTWRAMCYFELEERCWFGSKLLGGDLPLHLVRKGKSTDPFLSWDCNLVHYFQIFELLQGAKDPEAIIQAVPELINAKILASVLITINKW